MKREFGQGQVVLVLVLVVVIVAIICAASGNALVTDPHGNVSIGKPEDFARATGVALAADQARAATQVAVNFEATTRAANARATATAVAQSIQATQTAVPYQAGIAQNEASAKIVATWSVTAGLAGGLLAVLLCGFAFAAWLRTRSRVVWAGANGPVVLVGNTLVDTGKMIGPVATVPGDDKLISLERIRHYLKTGQIITRPAPTVQLADGGATADHYLAAAQASAQANALGAMFRPDNADRGREEKLELLDKKQVHVLPQSASAPVVHVIDDPQRIEHITQLLESEGA